MPSQAHCIVYRTGYKKTLWVNIVVAICKSCKPCGQVQIYSQTNNFLHLIFAFIEEEQYLQFKHPVNYAMITLYVPLTCAHLVLLLS